MEEVVDAGGPGAEVEAVVDPSGTPVLKLIGEIDISTVGRIRSAIEPVLAGQSDRIVFDLRDLRFMDSSGLTMLLAIAEKVAEVELRNASQIIRTVIELTGLSSVFTIAP